MPISAYLRSLDSTSKNKSETGSDFFCHGVQNKENSVRVVARYDWHTAAMCPRHGNSEAAVCISTQSKSTLSVAMYATFCCGINLILFTVYRRCVKCLATFARHRAWQKQLLLGLHKSSKSEQSTEEVVNRTIAILNPSSFLCTFQQSRSSIIFVLPK